MKRLVFWGTFLTAYCVILLSCSAILTVTPHHEKTDPVFEKYFEFVPFPVETVIGFKEADGIWDKYKNEKENVFTAGFCGTSFFPFEHQVSISKLYWNYASEHKKISLLIHELYHCQYGFGHDDSLMEDKCPKTLMHSMTIPDHCLKKHWAYYMNEIERRTNGS